MSANTAIPDSNFVGGFNIVTGAPIEDDDLLVFSSTLNGWVFQQASAIGVTLLNLVINTDKNWLNRTITNLGGLTFNQGTGFTFTTSGNNSQFTISPLLTTPALTGLSLVMEDRNSATIQREVEYFSSRVLDKITQKAVTASLLALYQLETIIETSNDVVAADAVIEFSTVAGTGAITNRSLFQINNLLTSALELTTTDLQIFGDIVFTASKTFNLFIEAGIVVATNTTSALEKFEFSQLNLGGGSGILCIDLRFKTSKATALNFQILMSINGATPFEIGLLSSIGGADIAQNASICHAFAAGAETFTFFLANPSGSGGSVTVFGNLGTQPGHSKLSATMVG